LALESIGPLKLGVRKTGECLFRPIATEIVLQENVGLEGSGRQLFERKGLPRLKRACEGVTLHGTEVTASALLQHSRHALAATHLSI